MNYFSLVPEATEYCCVAAKQRFKDLTGAHDPPPPPPPPDFVAFGAPACGVMCHDAALQGAISRDEQRPPESKGSAVG